MNFLKGLLAFIAYGIAVFVGGLLLFVAVMSIGIMLHAILKSLLTAI
jgi:hypothetical protein